MRGEGWLAASDVGWGIRPSDAAVEEEARRQLNLVGCASLLTARGTAVRLRRRA